MEISPSQQALLMFLCAAVGVTAGVVADIFWGMCLPFHSKAKGVINFLSDLCCTAVIFLGIIILSFYYDSGRIRFFDFLGAFVGFAAYRATFSHLIRLVFNKIIHLILRLIGLLMLPCRFLAKKVEKIIKFCKFYIAKSLEKIKYVLYNIYNNIIILKWARSGFISRRRDK